MQSFAISLHILSRTIVGYTLVISDLDGFLCCVFPHFWDWGCCDRKSSRSASSFPGLYFIFNSKSTSCISMMYFSLWGDSLAVALLNQGKQWFVCCENCEPLICQQVYTELALCTLDSDCVILGLAVSLLCVHECVANKVYQLPSFPCLLKQCC